MFFKKGCVTLVDHSVATAPPYQSNIYPSVMPVPAQPSVITVTQPTIPYGPNPVQTTCPFCNHVIRTSTKLEASTRAHIWCCFMFFFCCWPCSCVPCCLKSCQDVSHSCPNCKAFLGKYMS